MADLIVLEEIINKALLEKRNKEKKEQKSWYASSLGSCLRGMYYQMIGIDPDKEITSRELRVFDVGNQMEKWVIDLIVSQEGVKAEMQKRLYSEHWNIAGKPDLILEKGKDKRIFEIKTKHSRAFWWMQKEGKPMRQHEQQLWFYLKMENVEEGDLVYLSKDDLAIQQYIVRLDDEVLAKEVISQLKLLKQSWENKNVSLLPLPEKGSWQEKYCHYHSHCIK